MRCQSCILRLQNRFPDQLKLLCKHLSPQQHAWRRRKCSRLCFLFSIHCLNKRRIFNSLKTTGLLTCKSTHLLQSKALQPYDHPRQHTVGQICWFKTRWPLQSTGAYSSPTVTHRCRFTIQETSDSFFYLAEMFGKQNQIVMQGKLTCMSGHLRLKRAAELRVHRRGRSLSHHLLSSLPCCQRIRKRGNFSWMS